MHVRVRAHGLEVDLPWPWIPPRGIPDLLWWIDRLREFQEFDLARSPDWEKFLAYWILLNLEAADGKSSSAELHKVVSSARAVSWNALAERIGRHKDERVRSWVIRGLLTLAAPEGGMPDGVAARILWLYERLRTTPRAWPRQPYQDVRPRLSRLREALGGAGRPQLDEPREELAENVLRELAMDPAHPWNVMLSVEEHDDNWWLYIPLGDGGKGPKLMEVLSRRSFQGVSAADATPSPYNLLDLLWCNPVPNQATRTWSRFLRPGPERPAWRLRAFLDLVSSFQVWEEGAAALALAQMYAWLLREFEAFDGLQSWIRPDAKGTGLNLDNAPALEFALLRHKDPELIGSLRIFSTYNGWAWSVSGLPEDAAAAFKSEHQVFEATLCIMQSFVARREGRTRWDLKLTPLLEIAGEQGKIEELPFPPLVTWSDAEALRLTIEGALFFARQRIQSDPAQALVRWLVLVWVDTCWNLLHGRGINLLPSGRPRQPYPNPA